MCALNRSPLIVEATVEAWASSSSRVLDLTGYTDVVFTPVALDVTRSRRGGASGRLDVLFVGCIGTDGSSIQGALQTDGGKSSGLFFVVPADGYDVVVPQGFFRRDGDLLKNAGVAADGLSQDEFDKQLAQAAANPDCTPPDAGL